MPEDTGKGARTVRSASGMILLADDTGAGGHMVQTVSHTHTAEIEQAHECCRSLYERLTYQCLTSAGRTRSASRPTSSSMVRGTLFRCSCKRGGPSSRSPKTHNTNHTQLCSSVENILLSFQNMIPGVQCRGT